MCSGLQFPTFPMEKKMSILKQEEQVIVTRSVKEGEVRMPYPQTHRWDKLG